MVYVSKEVIRELKKNNWQPNQTNRFNFYHFLRKIKQKTNINPKTELTPHNLRRAFATYHAESGMPLPVLQKLLGHSSIRTTALYWKDIYSDDDDPDNILSGKKWLEREPPKSPPKIEENSPETLPKISDSDTLRNKPLITAEKPTNQSNLLLPAKTEKNLAIINYQSKLLISEISPKNQAKFSLNTSEQLPVITDREQKNYKEQFLLKKIEQLEEQLKQVQAENTHLKLENKHLKTLIRKDQKTETKILQPLPLKIKN